MVHDELPDHLVRLLNALGQLQSAGVEQIQVMLHDPSDSEIRVEQLFPPPADSTSEGSRSQRIIALNEPPEQVWLSLIDNYLMVALQRMISAALLSESHHRLMHLEAALSYLDEHLELMKRKSNALRQEEIIEEIEVILSNTGVEE